MSTPNATIHTHALTKTFGQTAALSNVDLAVPEGAIYALVGANGAGKTTIIKLLMNIFRPTSGTASVLGLDSQHIEGKAFNRIGYVSENQEMPEWMTVQALLEYMRPFYPTWDRTLEQQLVRQFDLPLKRKLKNLSRGMKMKAAFAASLAYRPSLIILETTIFLSSHDLAEIESFASHVGYLENGRMLFSEEMSVLSNRFRDIAITLPTPSPLPPGLPSTWLIPQTVDHVIRFVHSDYQDPATDHELATIFPSATDITADPMPLRSIFLAIAKSGRTHNPSPQSLAPGRRSEA
jgi:ABC-2 type transport system ATP-binding protein